jgi:Sulfotransferase family
MRPAKHPARVPPLVDREKGQPVSLTFVVGTGRCGSTMLSRILHENPEVLSVSEFFGVLKGATRRQHFPVEDMDGQELWQLLSERDLIFDAMIRDGLRTPEMCYPYGSGRFDPVTGVPRISHSTLPMLSDDPDGLFDKLAAEVPAWSKGKAADQYRALFCYLAGVLGRHAMVERSGSSLSLVPLMREQFPEARFVHMHRDGPDCALSMSRHPGYRFWGLGMEAARANQSPSVSLRAAWWDEIRAALPEQFEGLLSPPFDAERFMAYPIPLAFFGGLWSSMVCDGMASLGELPSDVRTSIKYEDVLVRPEQELARLADFLGVQMTPQWLSAAMKIVDPRRSGTAAQLESSALASLEAACEPGEAAIAAAAAW